MAREATAARKFLPSPLMGVYRFRQKIAGHTVWYAIDADGRFAGFRAVGPGMSEAKAVADLAVAVYGDDIAAPTLTLHAPFPSGSRSARALRALPGERRERSPRD